MKKIFVSIAALFFVCCIPMTAPAQKPAEYTSREEVAENDSLDRDFKIQGEYVGEAPGMKIGADLVAEGNGTFRVVAFIGGLPGEGWSRGDTRIFGKANLNEDGELEVVLEQVEDAQGRRSIAGENDLPPKLIAKARENQLIAIAPNDGSEHTFQKQDRKSPTLGLKVPEGAIVLFDDGNKNESLWESGKVNEKAKTLWAEAATKPFEKRPYTLHLEFMLSYMPTARGQARSNSGVYIDEAYECQILDSFGLDGKNNECGGFYTVAEPNVNMCYPPLQWQTYDIDFTPAAFDADGKKTARAKISVRQNGVVIHDGIEPDKETPGRKKEGPAARGMYLQGHGNKVQFRNIWLRYH